MNKLLILLPFLIAACGTTEQAAEEEELHLDPADPTEISQQIKSACQPNSAGIYIEATINGELLLLDTNHEKDALLAPSYGYSFTDAYTFADFELGMAHTNPDTSSSEVFINMIKVSFLNLFENPHPEQGAYEPEDELYQALVKTGTYPFGYDSDNSFTGNYKNGVSILFRDDEGNEYSSEGADQEGSYFYITSTTQDEDGQKVASGCFKSNLTGYSGKLSIEATFRLIY